MKKRSISKRTIPWVIIIVLLVSAIPLLSITVAAEGSGTATDPYLISNEIELKQVGTDSPSGWDLNAHYKLTANIVLGAPTPTDGGPQYPGNWTSPIGYGGHAPDPFVGSFDGAGFSITGIVIEIYGDNAEIGLFGRIGETGVVKNLTVGANINKNSNDIQVDYVGAIAGMNYGTISNCHNLAGGVVIGRDKLGGIAGANHGTIENSTNAAAISGDSGGESGSYIGGITGYNYGTIDTCDNTGEIKGSMQIGGITGDNHDVIKNSINEGSVTGTKLYIGGIAGDNNGNIENSRNSGSIKGLGFVGGIVGENFDSSKISGCTNSGSVLAEYEHGIDQSGEAVGGIVGGSSYGGGGSITSSINTGSITGYLNVGGIAGWVNDAQISNSYNTGSVRGAGYVGGVAGQAVHLETGLTVIERVFNAGNITFYRQEGIPDSELVSVEIGGLVGVIDSPDVILRNSYNTGSITVGSYTVTGSNTFLSGIGGIAGFNIGKIENTYNAGLIKSDLTVVSSNPLGIGAIVGYNKSPDATENDQGTIVNSYFDSTKLAGMSGVGEGSSTGTTGLSTRNMVSFTARTTMGFDTTIWRKRNFEYPNTSFYPELAVFYTAHEAASKASVRTDYAFIYNTLTHFGTWTGSGTSKGTVEADNDAFSHLLLNNHTVSTGNYTTESGSTIITLNQAYLQTLANGTHNYRAIFFDGYATVQLIVNVPGNQNVEDDEEDEEEDDVPQLGEARTTAILIIAITLSGLAIVTFLVYHARKKKSNN
ncbi:MAG: hypothetical protein LBC71_00730 [Oscillospiraceae bacterium]|nr:hypothetical protein [Oscillospiraceae bacterium]